MSGLSAGERLRLLAPHVVIVVGIVLLGLPLASQWVEAWRASMGIDAVVRAYDEMTEGGDLAARLPYGAQLSWRGSQMIAYVSIPRCAVRLPIYHGTDGNTLMVGVGHVEATSLPAGAGASGTSHCVLTAHTGMPGRRMFDDIRLLEVGDVFEVWALGKRLAYRVVGSEVLLPEEAERCLGLVAGRDLVTLVTCTPYGVNSHRLLVTAERCDANARALEVADASVYVNARTAPLLVALVAVLVLALGGLRRRRWRKEGDGNV